MYGEGKWMVSLLLLAIMLSHVYRSLSNKLIRWLCVLSVVVGMENLSQLLLFFVVLELKLLLNLLLLFLLRGCFLRLLFVLRLLCRLAWETRVVRVLLRLTVHSQIVSSYQLVLVILYSKLLSVSGHLDSFSVFLFLEICI